ILLAATVSGPASAVPVIPSAALLSAGRAVSPAVLSLTDGVVHAMLVQKLKAVAAVLLLTATAGAVTSRTTQGDTRVAGGGTPARTAPPASPEEPPVKDLDRWEKLLRDRDLTAKQRAASEQIPSTVSSQPGADEVQKLKAEIAKLREENAQL